MIARVSRSNHIRLPLSSASPARQQATAWEKPASTVAFLAEGSPVTVYHGQKIA